MDFVDLSYQPKENDLICDFYVEPFKTDLKVVAGAVAAESSIGTWTELTTTKPYMEKLHATVFEVNDGNIRVAYPIELFEKSNMPNILSSVAGNVFGLGALDNLRLNDIHFPTGIIASFKGPRFGIDGIRKMLKATMRPLVGTIVKPKLGLSTADHARIAYEAWVGGCDLVKDDENLSNQRFNPFKERVVKTLESRDQAEQETGEKKVYLANVTSETDEMLKRAQFIQDHGGRYLMVDILTCGFSALQTLRNQDFKLVIHAHRAGHAAYTRNTKHGISMLVLAKISRLIGVDQLHVGTAVGKMSEPKEEVLQNCEALRGQMEKLRPVLPVASGGLHPALVPSLIDIFGKDFVIQAGGGIHGHVDGTQSGARAMRQAVDAKNGGVPLKEYARDHRELRIALEVWRRT
ncbi:MAG: type III ribulose-bisphosphate carboxylase [Candidatus Bathyarchaeota archaeon]|nr:MAG: type III ribulose-bisphosphate carboxylase [Candidatus Bathyarchaeota archaeon]